MRAHRLIILSQCAVADVGGVASAPGVSEPEHRRKWRRFLAVQIPVPLRGDLIGLGKTWLSLGEELLNVFLKSLFVNHADISSGDPALLVNQKGVWHVANAIGMCA